MGLCKCPKKKVTNLFCFEHTVNVCEHCLVANHNRCVVQSYLQWLQDSDYDPSCRLCGKNLTDESCGPCVRLLCYDLFHWSCLDSFARSLPANTAPAGYGCPICHVNLFPQPNAVSPVVDALKEFLSQVNWARAGLGLPMIDEPEHKHTANGVLGANSSSSYTSAATSAVRQLGPAPGHMQNILDETAVYARSLDKGDFFAGGQGSLPSDSLLLNVSANDHDHDKYKRRPALQWLSRWFSSQVGSGGRHRKDPNATLKRYVICGLLIVLAIITLIIIFSKLGRSVTDDDPSLDPLANPNIRVQNK